MDNANNTLPGSPEIDAAFEETTKVAKLAADPIAFEELTPLVAQAPEEGEHFILAFLEWKRDVITSVEEMKANLEASLRMLTV